MTHDDAMTEAVDRLISNPNPEQHRTIRMQLQQALDRYLEVRGAVLCNGKPVAWVKHGGLVRIKNIDLPNDTFVYSALPPIIRVEGETQ